VKGAKTEVKASLIHTSMGSGSWSALAAACSTLLVVSHVGGNHQRRAAGGFDVLGGGVQADCAAGEERDLRPALGEETRRGPADAAPSTGDDNYLSTHGLACRRGPGRSGRENSRRRGAGLSATGCGQTARAPRTFALTRIWGWPQAEVTAVALLIEGPMRSR